MKTNDLIESLALEPAVTSRSFGQVVLQSAGLVLVLLLGLSLIYSLRVDLAQKLSEPWFTLDLVLLGGSAGLSLWVACKLGVPVLEGDRWWPKLALLPFAGWMMSLLGKLYLTWSTHPELVQPSPMDFFCIQNFMLFLLVPGLFFLFQLKTLAPVHPHWSAGLALLSATSMGNLALMLLESQDGIYHQVAWHLMPTLMFVGLGLCWGKKILKW